MGWCGPQRSGKLDRQNEETTEMREVGRGSMRLSLGSILSLIPQGQLKGSWQAFLSMSEVGVGQENQR